MPRKSQHQKKFEAVLQDVVFLPSPEMRKTKAAFWASHSDNPLTSGDTITLAAALQVVNDTRLQKWWSLPGFSEWFTNREEFRQRLEYLANLSLDTVEELLLSPDANPNARMNAAKLMLEAAAKMPQKWNQVKYLDEDIGRMGKRELEAYLKKYKVIGEIPEKAASVDEKDKK